MDENTTFDVSHSSSRRPVVSLAVLCDDQPKWRPHHFQYNIWDCTLGIRFSVVNLLVEAIRDVARLRELLQVIKTAKNLARVRQRLREQALPLQAG